MKKIVRITELDLVKIVKKILTEENIVTNFDKSFDYKKDGDKYYFKGKGKFKSKYPDWTLAKDKKAIDSIKTKVFKDSKKIDTDEAPPGGKNEKEKETTKISVEKKK